MSEVAKAKNLGYYSHPNGKSYYLAECECGEKVKVFAWRGEKRCPNCKKVISHPFSFMDKEVK